MALSNKPFAVATIALALIGAAFANRATKSASKPVSRYMRDMGIVYLETVKKLTPDCGRKSNSDDDCMSRWESIMENIEDRINIALSDMRYRPSGDTPYWDLLKNVKYARKFYVIAAPEQREAWSHAYITCEAHAHTIALEGNYFDGDGGCGTAIDAATLEANRNP